MKLISWAQSKMFSINGIKYIYCCWYFISLYITIAVERWCWATYGAKKPWRSFPCKDRDSSGFHTTDIQSLARVTTATKRGQNCKGLSKSHTSTLSHSILTVMCGVCVECEELTSDLVNGHDRRFLNMLKNRLHLTPACVPGIITPEHTLNVLSELFDKMREDTT